MKKSMILVLALAMALALSACGGKDGNARATSGNARATGGNALSFFITTPGNAG